MSGSRDGKAQEVRRRRNTRTTEQMTKRNGLGQFRTAEGRSFGNALGGPGRKLGGELLYFHGEPRGEVAKQSTVPLRLSTRSFPGELRHHDRTTRIQPATLSLARGRAPAVGGGPVTPATRTRRSSRRRRRTSMGLSAHTPRWPTGARCHRPSPTRQRRTQPDGCCRRGRRCRRMSLLHRHLRSHRQAWQRVPGWRGPRTPCPPPRPGESPGVSTLPPGARSPRRRGRAPGSDRNRRNSGRPPG